MTKQESEFLILKLRSGDEIIGKKTGGSKNALILNRPLQLQRSTLLDPITGEVRKNICVFRDWLEFTTVLDSEIPTDHIVMSAPPSPDLVKRYLQELSNLDNPKPKKAQKPLPQTDIKEDILDNFFKALATTKQEKPQTSAPLDSILSKLGGMGGSNINPNMVTATFHMPPEVFMNIMLSLPLFDMGDISDLDDDSGDSDFGDDDGEDEPKTPPQPKNTPKKNKPKPNTDEEPPQGWQGRFGFPK
jgi:hypothetical protein